METTKCICVWLDTTSDDWGWIVSLDELDGRGRAESTHTLRSYEVDVVDGEIDADSSAKCEAEAWEFARSEAKKRGLPRYANPENGPAKLIANAD